MQLPPSPPLPQAVLDRPVSPEPHQHSVKLAEGAIFSSGQKPPNQDVDEVPFLLEALGESHFLAFSNFCLHSSACGPSFHLPIQQHGIFQSPSPSPSLPSSPPPPPSPSVITSPDSDPAAFPPKDPCDYHRPTQLVWDDPSISTS